MAIVMKFGDKIKGESEIEGYKDWITLESCQWGVGRGLADPSSTGSSSTREGTKASVSEITVSKVLDNSSPGLLRDALDGKIDTTVKITFLRTGQGKPEPYLEFILEKCGLSGYSMSSGGDRPGETLALNFTKVEYKYYAVGDGLTGTGVSTKYDLSKAVASGG